MGKILIVDDSLTMRMVLKKIMAMINLPFDEIVEAANGEEALDILHGGGISLILMDINMPVMSGLELLERISEDESLSGTPAIVITPEGSDESLQKCWDLGVKGFIRKPFTPETVKAEIEKVMGK